MKMKKFLSWVIKPIEWLFDYEFYWWERAIRRPLGYQEGKEFKRDKMMCEIKGWALILLAVVTMLGYPVYIALNSYPTLTLFRIITSAIASCFFLFAYIHLIATRTPPKPKE